MKLYIAGPMTGIDLFNWPAFERAAAGLRLAGHEVFSPAEQDEEKGWTIVHRAGGIVLSVEEAPGFDYEAALALDFGLIEQADGIYLLEGWHASSGAKRELRHALIHEKQVYFEGLHEPEYATSPDDFDLHLELHRRFEEGLVPGDEYIERLRAESQRAELARVVSMFPLGEQEEIVASFVADDANPKDAIGMRKPPLHLVPAAADIWMAEAFRDGAAKYGPFNWRDKAVRATVYVAAARRHLAAWFDGEETAADSGVHHLGHALASIAIILDAQASDTMLDDRPTKGAAARLIHELTREGSA